MFRQLALRCLGWMHGSSFAFSSLLRIMKRSMERPITQIIGPSLHRVEPPKAISTPSHRWAGQRDNRHSERLYKPVQPQCLSGLHKDSFAHP